MRPIAEIAEAMGLDPHAIIPYGPHKAKVPLDAIRDDGPRGKLVVVTGMTPTRAGEGKTTTTIGLTQGLGRLGKRVVATIREPSLGPVFGIKGGGTGGGASLVEPQDEINVHFTGDAHAVGSAHNLLAALTDNAVQRGKIPDMDSSGIALRRVTDVEDRALRSIVTGLGGSTNAPVRDTGFDIVTASEVHGDPGAHVWARGPPCPTGKDRGGVQQRGEAGDRRGCRGRRLDDVAPTVRHTAEPGADYRGAARDGPRRTLRKHSPRLQLCLGRPFGPRLRRLRLDRGGIRRGPGL